MSADYNKHVNFRFYAELNDFLPQKRRFSTFEFAYHGRRTVKDIIEALGVPHVEVDLIVADGLSVGFDFIPKGGELISVYPVFESFDITPIVKLREKPLRKSCFIVDVNLGKLARHLRMLGFDTVYTNNYEDADLVKDAVAQHRIILTRDLGVLKYKEVTHGYFVRSDDPEEQVREVIRRFDLKNEFKPFSRCLDCNGEMEAIAKESVESRVPEEVYRVFDKFFRCSQCSQVYWRGSHYDTMIKLVERLKNED